MFHLNLSVIYLIKLTRFKNLSVVIKPILVHRYKTYITQKIRPLNIINFKRIFTIKQIRNEMEDVSEVFITDFIPSIYTSPCTMYYVQNGKQKKCDIFAERNGVVMIIYNKTRDVLILVKQFRASVYFQKVPEEERIGRIDVVKYPPKLGITLEWCAGLEDKEISTEKVAQEEILEECGYKVELSQLEKIGTIKNLSITTGARSTFFYCEVTDDMRVSEGGGEVGENVEVVEMPVKDVIKYATNKEYVASPINFMYGFYWFLLNKYDKK